MQEATAAAEAAAAAAPLAPVQQLWTPDGRYDGEVRRHPRPDGSSVLHPEAGVGIVKHGRGRLARPNGDKYEGEFDFDSMCGTGVLTCTNGDLYEGEFWGNLRHGIGVEEFVAGGSYAGQWRHGNRHGKGDEVLADGERFEGLFQDDRRHGFGLLRMPSGVVLRGEFARGLPHGQCLVEYPNGDTYEGAFRNGERYGTGRCDVKSTGVVHCERYEAGRCVLGALSARHVVSLRLPNGDTYDGAFQLGGAGGGDTAADLSETGTGWAVPVPGARDGAPRGAGVLLRKGGARYEGAFAGGVPEGEGELRYAASAAADEEGRRPVVYRGAFHAGEPEGWGALTLSNGDVREGAWKRGEAHGLQWDFREGDPLQGAWHSAHWAAGQEREPNRYPRTNASPRQLRVLSPRQQRLQEEAGAASP